jgi:hypothetical protein
MDINDPGALLAPVLPRWYDADVSDKSPEAIYNRKMFK